MTNENKQYNKKILVIGLSGESVFLDIDHFNKNGETINALKRHVEPGGKGYNQAIALGKLGADVSFITTFGKGSYGDECLKYLNINNVKTYNINKDSLGSYAVIIVDKDGNNNVICEKGASSEVTFDDIMKHKSVLDACDIYLLQLEYNEDAMKKVIEYGYQNGKTIILNPAPRCYLDTETLKKVNVLTPNEFEISFIKKEELTDVHIICTKGDKGSQHIYNGLVHNYSCKKVKAIDTTGAGDVFNAGLVYALSQDNSLYKNIDKYINFATSCSACKVMKKGIVDAIPSLEDVIKMMNN